MKTSAIFKSFVGPRPNLLVGWALAQLTFLLLACSTTPIQESKPVSHNQEINPVAAGYNIQLGLAYLKQGDVERAKHKLITAKNQNPNSAEVSGALAYFMEKTGDINLAESYYQKAMIQAPKRGGPINNYGAFLCRQGQYQKAISYFLKAVNDFQYEHSSGAYENAALCALQIPDETLARTYFNKAMEQDPSKTTALEELVRLDLKNHQPEHALEEIKRYTANIIKNKKLLTLAITAAKDANNQEYTNYFQVQLDNLTKHAG